MTAPTPDPRELINSEEPGHDPVRTFRDTLPSWAVHDLDWTDQAIADIHKAITDGWTVDELVERVTDRARGYYNADQVMRHRLHQAAHPDETTT